MNISWVVETTENGAKPAGTGDISNWLCRKQIYRDTYKGVCEKGHGNTLANLHQTRQGYRNGWSLGSLSGTFQSSITGHWGLLMTFEKRVRFKKGKATGKAVSNGFVTARREWMFRKR